MKNSDLKAICAENRKSINQILSVLNEVSEDSRHPINDHKHPEHALAVSAFNRLLKRVDELERPMTATPARRSGPVKKPKPAAMPK